MAQRQPTKTAETLAQGQRDISVSEFFAKNRHLLGFDNPRKALLTTVKEAVDNALDACEEAGILPEIEVRIEELTPPPAAGSAKNAKSQRAAASRASAAGGRYRVTIRDNGPGIVRKQVENIFGRLLYGSKFHRLKMSRGQQGIGISAAGMYGLMTTGKPMVITTRPHKSKPAHHIELAMDTTKNKPVVSVDVETDDFPPGTGTRVAIELEARYTKGKTSVDEYLEQTAIANPHAQITFFPPAKSATTEDQDAEQENQLPGLDQADASKKSDAKKPATDEQGFVRTQIHDDRIVFPRTVDELPPETSEIKPHPHGVELGTFLQMLSKTEEKFVASFLKNGFSRVPPAIANDVLKAAKLPATAAVKNVDHAAAEKIYHALQHAKLRNPPTDCLSPIGVRQILAGLLKGVKAEFYSASTRPPTVYRGMPFQIEVGLAFGGQIAGAGIENDKDAGAARLIRFANRVPLLYQQSACSAFKAVTETAWKNYGLSQPRGSLPQAPLVIMIHMASVWVPFTSESKEAIADYDDIRKEMKLALQDCGRKLSTYLRKRQRMKREGQKRDVFERYIGEIAMACNAINGVDTEKLYEALMEQAKLKTDFADVELDDEGRVIKQTENGVPRGMDKDDSVIILLDEPPTPPSSHSPPPASGSASADLSGPRGNRPTSGAQLSAEPKPTRKAKGGATTKNKRQSGGKKPSTKPSASAESGTANADGKTRRKVLKKTRKIRASDATLFA